MRGAEAIDDYEALDEQEAFDIEYWPLEEAKLQRMPPEKELDRQVVVVVGAGAGIGKATAHRLVAGGRARRLRRPGRGGGEGDGGGDRGPLRPRDRRGRDRASATAVRPSASAATSPTARASPGCSTTWSSPTAELDAVVVTAGVFVAPDASGRIDDRQWALTFGVNVTGAYIVADEAHQVFKAQGLPGSVVLTTSANAVVAKKGSLAYDTSKAAANHLVRELAVEMAPLVRVNGVAPATVVKGSTMFPRDRVIASLAKYEIPFARRRDRRTRCATSWPSSTRSGR